MPEISRFLGIVIKMFFSDHAPPHFHAFYGDFEACFCISSLELISGTLPPRVTGLVIEWATINQRELSENWDSLNKTNDGSFKKIKPLV